LGALTSDWSLLDPDGSVPAYASTLLVRPSTLLAAGGLVSTTDEDGGISSVWTKTILTASIDINGHKAGQLAPLGRAALTVGRGQARLLVDNDLLFAAGGNSSDTAFADAVDVAHIDANGVPGPFAATEHLPTPILLPELAAGGGKLFAIGGVIGEIIGDNQVTAKVHVATIRADGALSPWSAVPDLPIALALGGALVHDNRLYYFGGQREVVTSDGGIGNQVVDTIYALDLLPTGGFGTWREVGKLPAPRAGLAVVIF